MNSGFIESNSIHVKRNTKLFPGTYLSTGPTALLQTYVIVWTTFLAFWFLAEGGWIIFQIFHGHLLFTFLSIHLSTYLLLCHLTILSPKFVNFRKIWLHVWKSAVVSVDTFLQLTGFIKSSKYHVQFQGTPGTTALWINMQMYLSSTDEFERQKLVPLSFINI